MPYTPELDDSACTTLRRLSWAISEPMTKTMLEVFKFLPLLMDSGKVCSQCEDTSKCDSCYFNRKNQEESKNELFTAVIEKANLKEEFITARLAERTKPRKKKSPALCKSCKDKIAKHQKRQANGQQEESKEWRTGDGPFFEE